MEKCSNILILFIFCTCAQTLYGESSGHVKVFPGVQQIPAMSDDGQNENISSIMMDTRAQTTNDIFSGQFKLAYSLGLSYYSKAISSLIGNASAYRYDDLRQVVHNFEGGKAQLTQNLDRVVWIKEFTAFDLKIGRQAFAYGVARIANPSDVFAPFPLQRLDQEYRFGLDGIRVNIPTGPLSEWELASIFGEDGRQDKSAQLIRYKTSLHGIDQEVILSHFRKASLLGLNTELPLGDLGVRIEGAVVRPENEASYTRLVIGTAYMMAEGGLWDLEYYFNGAGSKTRFTYSQSRNRFAYTQGGVFFQAQHYLSASYQDSINPLLSHLVQLIVNLTDSTSLGLAQLTYNSSDNSYLDFGFFLSPYHQTKAEVYQGEFASLGQQVFASARYYW